MKLIRNLGVAACLGVLALAAPAQADPSAKPLKASEIRNFVSALPAFQEAGKAYEANRATDAPALMAMKQYPKKPCSAGMAAVEQAGDAGEFARIARQSGFGSLSAFGDICDRTIRAYAASKMAESGMSSDGMSAQMQKMRESLEQMPPAMRQQMEQQMMGMMNAATQLVQPAHPQDLETIKPYLNALDGIVDEQQ